VRTREQDVAPFISLADITEIELVILRRMDQVTIGDHKSRATGSGFDLIGLRDWQAGDAFSSIDWPQSTLTNFSPLVVRDFEQPSTASVVVVADRSASTRCGISGLSIAALIARAIATFGVSAVFFQDQFGLMTFDGRFDRLRFVRPRVGKGQVVRCLDAYQHDEALEDVRQGASISMSVASCLRTTSLIPVVSDFLFDQPDTVLRELELLNASHDVVMVMIDSAFAYSTIDTNAAWVDAFDVETGKSRVMSRAAFQSLGARARAWQDEIERRAKDLDLDVVRLGADETSSTLAMSEFIVERRLRKR
jgi:uncharacterized protein (DUF58 family)